MLLFVGVLLVACVQGDNFPSLITSNATLAVVIDREYIGDDFEMIREAIDTYLVFAKREILKHGGVNVQYFTWANINIKRDITALISIASCADTWQLFRAAEDQKLLHMAISETDCPRLPPNEAITIPLVKRGEEMPQVVLDLRTIRAYDWKSAVIVFDHTLERDFISRVANSFTTEFGDVSATGGVISLIKLSTSSSSVSQNRQSIIDSLSGISTKTVGRNFLAVVSLENVEVLMEAAKLQGLVNTRNHWLYVLSDTDGNNYNITKVKRLLREGDNVSFMYNTTTEDDACKSGLKCHIEELLEAFTKALDAAIQEEFDLSSLVSDEEWEAIRPSKSERRDSLLSSIKNQLFQNGGCDNCTTWRFQAGDTWGREYQENSTSVAELIYVGSWRPSDGCRLVDELFPHVSHGFRGRNLPMVSFHNPPWQILKTNSSGHVMEFKGLVFDIMKEISESLNFTYTVEVKVVASKKENESEYSGFDEVVGEDSLTSTIPDFILEMIRTKTAAISACCFTVTDKVKEKINFTMPISTQSYTFLVARPRELSRALLFMSPFSQMSWLCISLVLLSMGPILYIIDKMSPVYAYKGLSMKSGLKTVQNCIWYMYGALLQQGGMHLPSADSSRIIVGAWWLVVLVITTTYCGNLVAFLTFPKIDIPIRTIDEILEHRQTVTWSVSKNSFFDHQLKVTNEPKYKTLRDGMITDNQDLREMLSRIEQGKHVHIDWKMKLQYMMKNQFVTTDRCDLALGLEEFSDEQIALIMAQDTPYMQIFNDEIKRLHQVGLISKWLENYLPKKDKCFKMKYTEVSNHTVNLDDMQGSFFVLFIGFAISLLIMLMEKLCSWYKLKNKKEHIEFTS